MTARMVSISADDRTWRTESVEADLQQPVQTDEHCQKRLFKLIEVCNGTIPR